MSSTTVTAYWPKTEFLGHGTRRRGAGRALSGGEAESAETKVAKVAGQSTGEERILQKENSRDKEKVFPLSIEQILFHT